MKAIILAGGKGTRLAPYSTILPKPLMPVGDMPIVEIILNQLSKTPFNDIVLSVGHLSSLIRAYFESVTISGISLSYSLEEEPLGTAGPIKLIPGLKETFLVMNGDVLTDVNFSQLYSFHKEKNGLATMMLKKRHVNIDFGIITVDKKDRVLDYTEKPKYEYLVSAGIYLFEPAILDYIQPDEHLDLPDLITRIKSDGQTVHAHIHDGYWLDIGRIDDYEQAVQDFPSKKSLFLPSDP